MMMSVIDDDDHNKNDENEEQNEQHQQKLSSGSKVDHGLLSFRLPLKLPWIKPMVMNSAVQVLPYSSGLTTTTGWLGCFGLFGFIKPIFYYWILYIAR